MRLTGSAEFVAERDHVWTFLIDPANFGPCSPVPIERVDDGRYVANMRVGSGLFSTTLRLDLEVTDVVAGRSARIVASGGASGATVDGSSTFEIRAGSMDGTTTVDWEVEFRISGMFAGPAERLIGERGPEAVERLLACIHQQVEGHPGGPAPASTAQM